MGLRDLRGIMRQQVPAEAWKHFNGAAESKATFHRNPRVFQQYLFRQNIFHEVSDPDISIELLGQKLPLPAITAPVGSFSLIGKDAERQVAEGTDRAGAMMFVSQAAKFNLHDWRNADKSPLVFMAYMNRGRPEVEEYAKAAEDLGFAAVGITMDTVKPVKIGDSAFVGVNSVIMPGVTIGRSAVVASGAVVLGDVPPFTLVAGNPARVVKRFPAPEGGK